MRGILVTGFEPFGGDETNPSWDVCKGLGPEVTGVRVETLLVPCEFRRSIEVVIDAIERLQPRLVICLGLAGSRALLGVERLAINVDDARIPDNRGARPLDTPVVAGGPPAYFATLPIKAMAAAMREAGAPTEVSNSAGTFVCNHLMYGVLHHLATSGSPTRAGFIHVPRSMALATMVQGVRAGISAALAHRRDTRATIGAAEGALD